MHGARQQCSRVTSVLLFILAASTLAAPPAARAWCPSAAYSYTYYSGCGSAPTLVGDNWTECSGATGGWGTTGNWRERLKYTCIVDSNSCINDVASYTYWTLCSGNWVARTQAQMLSGDCSCPAMTPLGPSDPAADLVLAAVDENRSVATPADLARACSK